MLRGQPTNQPFCRGGFEQQILKNRSSNSNNQDAVFGILSRVLEYAPDFATSWGLAPLLVLHNKVLHAVDEDPTDTADRCYAQVRTVQC